MSIWGIPGKIWKWAKRTDNAEDAKDLHDDLTDPEPSPEDGIDALEDVINLVNPIPFYNPLEGDGTINECIDNIKKRNDQLNDAMNGT